MKKYIITCLAIVVIVLVCLAYFVLYPKAKTISNTNNDNIALISFLKDNNLQGAVVQNVDTANKSTVSLVKSDGTIQELFDWTDAGTHNCGFSYLSDCSDRKPIRTRFLNSSRPVDVLFSQNSVHVYDYSRSVDISQYFQNLKNVIFFRANESEFRDYSSKFSPDMKFVFDTPIFNTPEYKNGGMILSNVDYIYSKNYDGGKFAIAGKAISVIPNISVSEISWTPDSRYLFYEDDNASKISVYDTLTNVKTELQGTFVPRTVIIAISGNEFIEARTDGTYLASIVDGVVSESKLLSPETKIVGLIF